MTKRLKLLYAFLLLAVALPLLTACSSDDATGENNTRKGEKVTVRLRISQAAPAMTRAWQDTNATDDEMMNVWTVVAVKSQDGTVTNIWACKPQDNNQEEIDDISEIEEEFETNTSYRFYSFANISPAKVMSLLNIPSAEVTDNAKQVKAENFGTVDKNVIKKISFTSISIADGVNPDVQVNGNFFNPSADDNGFGAKGIPMSNVQTFRFLEDSERKDLIVVRMLAKMELKITNDGTDAVTIKSITLTDITKNAKTEGGNNEGTANLKLFPKYTEQDNADKMDAVHGDIRPSLATSASTAPLEITSETQGIKVSPSDDASSSAPLTIAQGKTKTISFYINESATPRGKNQFDRFYLKLNLSKGTDTEKTGELRYTLIDDSNKENNDEGKWDYIARNDYRIIPISLGDYKLELIPYDFPAIGVYPASIKEEDGLNTITFHDYGHFHLQPKVTKFTTSGTELVPYGTEAGQWSLVNNSFADSWHSWASYEASVANPTIYYNNEEANPAFYRKGHTGDSEGSETGGFPVWYPNTPSTPSNPQWASDWAPSANGTVGYQPFIFGYIADPGESIKNGDKKVYHEFSINLYKQGTAARQMTYRLYMILDTGQMMYPDPEDSNGSRALGAPAFRHTHGH